MFEPEFDLFEIDELKIAVSLPNIDSITLGELVPFSEITTSGALNTSLDALFVSGLEFEQLEHLSKRCEQSKIELTFFENPTSDALAIQNVVLNLVDKLYSNQMPNNIDVADIRNLNNSSDFLFAFDSKYKALDFLQSQNVGTVIGGVYLAQDMDEYEKTGSELGSYVSEYGYLCVSLHTQRRSESTIMLGIKRSKRT